MSDVICCKISELLEKTESLHEQALSRQHEVKAVLHSLNTFNSRAASVSMKLAEFKENVRREVAKALSADVDAIKTDLRLIKVLVLAVVLLIKQNYLSRTCEVCPKTPLKEIRDQKPIW